MADREITYQVLQGNFLVLGQKERTKFPRQLKTTTFVHMPPTELENILVSLARLMS